MFIYVVIVISLTTSNDEDNIVEAVIHNPNYSTTMVVQTISNHRHSHGLVDSRSS